jgi:DNA-binding response OmpR family regulator
MTRQAKGTILVIEDDRSLREGLVMNLELEGYSVVTAADGNEGMRLAFDAHADLIVLDLALPGWGGMDILDELRKRRQGVPVLILSARGQTRDKVKGLNSGADDYMTKPFDLQELIARIEVMLRRTRAAAADRSETLLGNIRIDHTARTAHVGRKRLQLSAREFDLLCLLAGAPSHVFTRDTILEQVWGWDYEGTERTVDNFVSALRKKLGTARTTPRIRTVPCVGYTMESS